MHEIHLSDAAYQAFERRARALGISVEEYIDRSAPTNEFTLSPEMRAGIERGLAQADAGETVSLLQVRESLAKYKAEWRDEKR